MAEIFGIEFKRKKPEPISFAPKQTDDGAVVVSAGGSYGTYVDLDGSVRTEAELINKYRDMAEYPEVDSAIEDIINEIVVQEPETKAVELVLDDVPYDDKVKKVILQEFDNILNLLEFNSLSYDIVRRWYVDGRLYYHAITDEAQPQNGITELRYIDPRKIRKIREIKKKQGNVNLPDSQTENEYFMYNDKGFAKTINSQVGLNQQIGGIKIAKDSIVYCPSGMLSKDSDIVISYLHKAIRPLNNLRSMEDSLVIYRISRAPERRIFYIDVGNLPPRKAEEYVRSLMTKFKNKLVYDSQTGEVRDDRKFMTMLEDFWLPRREGGKGTEISTLPGGQNLGEITDIIYFQKKLYKSLNVPVGRLDDEAQFNFGRATEISRDEVKFDKFITKLRSKFSTLFTKILEKQLVLKGVITLEDWDQLKNTIKYKFARDNFFSELKESEILRDRLQTLQMAQPFVGTYYSYDYCRRQILKQTDEEIEEINSQNVEEKSDPNFYPPEETGGEESQGPPSASDSKKE